MRVGSSSIGRHAFEFLPAGCLGGASRRRLQPAMRRQKEDGTQEGRYHQRSPRGRLGRVRGRERAEGTASRDRTPHVDVGRLSVGAGSASKQRVDDDGGHDQNRRSDRHLSTEGALVRRTPGLPSGPPLLEIRGWNRCCQCRRRLLRGNGRDVDGHATLTQESFGEGWAMRAEGSEKHEVQIGAACPGVQVQRRHAPWRPSRSTMPPFGRPVAR